MWIFWAWHDMCEWGRPCDAGEVLWLFPAVIFHEAHGHRPGVVGGPVVVAWVLPCDAQVWCYLLVHPNGVCGRGAVVFPAVISCEALWGLARCGQ